MGIVVVEGDVLGAKLRADDGSVHSPGSLPPGSYQLQVAFPNGDTIEMPAPLQVLAGETTTVRCDAFAQQCR